MNDFLNLKERETLEELIKISESVYSRYKKLIQLDINNEKENDEYKKNIYYLKLAIETEENKYRNLNITAEKSILYNNYLVNTKLSEEYLSSYDNAIINFEDDYKTIIRRVINNLLDIFTENSLSAVPSKVIEQLEKFGLNNVEQVISKEIKTSIIVTQSFETEIFANLLSLLNKKLENKKYLPYKQDLIKTKYNIIYLNKSIESEVLIHNFNIFSQVFDSSSVKDYLKINDYYFSSSKENFAKDKVMFYIEEILYTPNKEYNNKNLSLALKYMYLRSALNLIDDYETILEIILRFKDIVRYSTLYETRYEHSESIIDILKLLTSIKYERRKTEGLSLNKYFY